MEKFNGKQVCAGIAIGKIQYYQKQESVIDTNAITDCESEKKKFDDAKATAITQLNELYEKAVVEVGEEHASIFEVHAMMLEDDDFGSSVYEMIDNDKMSASYAVSKTGENISTMFANMEDEYFSARAADIKDISERVVNILVGNSSSNVLTENVILIADDLAPSETIQMDKSKLLGFVTKYGSSSSHTAILARTIGIPALIGVEIDLAWNGKIAIIDGGNGTIIVDPTQEVLNDYILKQEEEQKQFAMLQEYKGKDTVTKSGQKVNLYANIGNLNDLESVIANDAEGIGLFRSEFLYLESKDFPTEDEQFEAYKKVVSTMNGKKVIIRTLDIGADKQVDYFNLAAEENPALGYRAIRICLQQPDIFKTQLRALFRASMFGNLSIMYPMIISVEELHQIKKIVDEVKSELRSEGIEYKDVETGIMIETPAAAIISDLLAKEVDFFSIGTNDLTQYTLAVDRQNPKLETFSNPHHDAILRLIEMATINAHKEGKWIGICGELGADPELTEFFLKIGIDELSVNPRRVLPLRKQIIESN